MPRDVADDVSAVADPSGAAPEAPFAEPSFAEPWQARAFAIAVLAARRGCFTWSEWTHALGRELQGAADADYFGCWLSVLQSLLADRGTIGQEELMERRHAWADAYRRTPHGVPVKLPAP